MSKTPFVNLHVHSYFSLLDGLQPPAEYAKKAAEQGAPACALTDHGVMHGGVEFYKACKEAGIKPILGCEVYIAFNKLTDKRHQIDNKRTHCVLIAENNTGYENLLKMITIAHTEGYYYKPRVDWDLLKEHSEGIIALSACLNGDMANAVLNNDDQKAKEMIEKFQSTFGKDSFFLELQDHPTLPQQKIVNDGLIDLGKKYDVPLVATTDCHYVNPEDNVAQDIMLCIQTGKNVQDSGRMTMMDADYSMIDPDKIAEAFAHVPEAIENTVKIAERCNVELEFGKYHIPTYPLPEGAKDAKSYFRELCYKGLDAKYKEKAKEQAVIDRLEYELKIIEDMGFINYFLIVWDFVKWAKDHNIMVGPGRGSAAGAIVSYALDITTIDPLKYGLLFEAFLNPARISMPDIDLDFADHRRDEVIEYVTEKYGKDKVAQICTFGTLAARAAVKDVGRVLGVGFGEMNEFAKLIPERPGTKLDEAFEQSPELVEAIEKNEIYQQVWENAKKLEGAVRHVSVHACAVVIADEPLTKYTALQNAPKDDNIIITQYNAKPLEALGLLKMDFLGLKNLTILERALEIIERTKGDKINLKEIPIDDKKAFALLSRGETTGVFQLESAGMRRYLKDLRPTEFEDIIAMVSLYRPGPMEWIPDYIKGKHGQKRVQYLHPDLEPLLNVTFGIAIYQEQILQIAQEFAGFSLGEADLLRRAIGKKIASELAAQREKFIAGAIEKGYTESVAQTIFDKVIEPFAGYGFNKSHAACYARIAYETAYLKAHYPTEFMTALMSADAGNTDKIVFEIGEAEQMGIKVLPPSVNESRSNFTVVEDGKIRFGLSAIKGLGAGSVRDLIEIRDAEGEFKNLEGFARRVPNKLLNKKTLEALAFSGAMGELGERNQIGSNIEAIAEFAKNASGDVRMEGQAGLFDDMDTGGMPEDHLELEEAPEAPMSQYLKWEKEYLGLYVSAHPLAGLQKYFKQKTIPLNTLPSKAVGKSIKVGGMLTGVRKIITKKGDQMAICFIEDPYGKSEVVVFPKTYSKVASNLVEDHVIIVEGKLERRMGEFQVVAKEVKAYTLEDLQEIAKEEGLWTDDEKIEVTTRAATLADEVETAEDVLDVDEDSVGSLDDGPLLTKPQMKQIILSRDVDRDFFVKLRDLFAKYPGDDEIELVIGEKRLPIPMKVEYGEALQKSVNDLLD